MKKLRWLLFVPAGVFEVLLAIMAGITTTLHFVSSIFLEIAYILPSLNWYCGGEYKRKPRLFVMDVKL